MISQNNSEISDIVDIVEPSMTIQIRLQNHIAPLFTVTKLKFMNSEKATKFCEISTIFDWQYIGQIIGGDFAKFCGLLRIYEL